MRCVGVQGWHGLAFAPDGKSLAAAAINQGLVFFWDVGTGQEKRRFATRRDVGRVLQFSPDGKRLAAGGMSGAVQVWDVATGKRLGQTESLPSSLASVAFPSDDRVLACANKNVTTVIRDVLADKLLTPVVGHESTVLGLSFSADGQILTSLGGDGMLYRWNTVTGQSGEPLHIGGPITPFPGNWERFSAAMLSPDGCHVLANDRNMGLGTRLFELPQGREVAAFMASQQPNMASPAAFSPDGSRLVVGSMEANMQPGNRERQASLGVYEVATGTEVYRVKHLPMDIGCLAFSADGKSLALSTYDRFGGKNSSIVRVLDSVTGKTKWEITEEQTMPAMAGAATFTPDGTSLVLQNRSGTITFHDAATGRKLRQLTGKPFYYQGFALPLVFSPNGRTFATLQEGGMNSTVHILVWEMVSGTVRHQFAGHTGSVAAMAFTPDSRRLATGGVDTNILVWDLTRRPEGMLTKGQPSAKEWEEIWTNLNAQDASTSYPAMCRMLAAPEATVAFLKKHLIPDQTLPNPQTLAKLIAGLDSDDPQDREKAMHQLEKLGPLAADALRKALESTPSAEVKIRLERILSRFDSKESMRQALRALEVLEWIDTAGARELLQSLAKQFPDTALGQAARETFDRLSRRPARQASEK